MKTALIVSGGWEGHKPEVFAQRLGEQLAKRDFKVEQATSLDALTPPKDLSRYSVIIPNWTMGTMSPEATKNLTTAVSEGVALAGIHGGMGDAFRGNTDYEWMVGGHFVGHPHVGDYTVEITDAAHPVTRGLPKSFPYSSEEYYLLTDPANHLLAQASYTHQGTTCSMPIAWTKQWGKGRVFYSSLGHDPKEFEDFPASLQLAIQGICWAAGA